MNPQMTGGVGEYLNQLRTSRGLSLSRLAAAAELSKRTLLYWEAGTHQPRLPELEALLNALDATPQEREQALARMDAPRAARSLRAEPRRLFLAEEVGAAPSGGDLLRAMRHRGHLSLGQVAESLRLAPSSLSRWEQGKSIPSPDALAALLTLLRAHSEERALLENRFLFLVPPLRATARSLEERWHQSTNFIHSTYHQREDPLHDLRFLTLIAAAWPFAAYSLSGRQLLAYIYACYASYLTDMRRYGEARRYVTHALDILTDNLTWTPYLMRALIVHAHASVFAGSRPSPKRGLAILRPWLPSLDKREYRAWAMTEMSQFLWMQGDREAALQMGEEACRVVAHFANPDELTLRRMGLAKLKVKAGHAEEAQALLLRDRIVGPLWRVEQHLVWVECLLALGKQAEAHDRLQGVYADIEAHNFIYLRPQADALARHF
jgi:transcriptional regulator with XRE-family HTH domain